MMGVTAVTLVLLMTSGHLVFGKEETGNERKLKNGFPRASENHDKQIRFLAANPQALLRMASINETLRRLLFLPTEDSGVNSYDISVCTSFDTAKGLCNYQYFKLLEFQNYWPYLESEKKISDWPPCGLGYGDSGCGSFRTLRSPCGTIGYNMSHIPGNRSCEWVINSDNGHHIRLDFEYFNIKYCGETCTCGSLIIYDLVKEMEKEYMFCGRRVPWSIVTASGRINITFVIQDSLPSNGFKLKYQAIMENVLPTSPPIKLSAAKSTLTIPSQPNRIEEDGFIYEWHIRVEETMKVKITWNLNSTCPKDTHVTLYEGPINAGRVITLPLKESPLNGTIYSESFQVSLKLQYLQSCNITAFQVFYQACEAEPTLSKNLVLQGDSISVSISTVEEALPVIRFYRYISPNRSYISMNITEYIFKGPNVNECENEGFIIWDGEGENSEKYGPFCGTHYYSNFFGRHHDATEHGLAIHTSTNTLTILFYSYGPTDGTVFDYSLDVTPCFGVFDWKKPVADRSALITLESSIRRIYSSKKKTCFHLQSLPSKNPCDTSETNIFVRRFRFFEITVLVWKYSTVFGCKFYQEPPAFSSLLYEFPSFEELCKCHITPGGYLIQVRTLGGEFYRTVMDDKHDLKLHSSAIGGQIVHKEGFSSSILSAPMNLYIDHHFCFNVGTVLRSSTFRVYIDENPDVQNRFLETSFYLEREILPFRFCSAWSFYVLLGIDFEPIHAYDTLRINYTLIQNKEPKEELKPGMCRNNATEEKVFFKKSCYDFRQSKFENVSWTAAQDICNKNGGQLLAINSEPELSFIKGMLKRRWLISPHAHRITNPVIYIGLARSGKGDRWSDGTPGIFTEWHRPLLTKAQIVPVDFTGGSGKLASPLIFQPNNDQSTNCTTMIVIGPSMPTHWIRIPCHYPYPSSSFVCEYPASIETDEMNRRPNQTDDVKSIKEHITELLPTAKLCPIGYNLFLNRCYRLISSTAPINRGLNCYAAKDLCSQFNSSGVKTATEFPVELLHIWLHRPEYGSVWIGDCDILVYNKTTGTWVFSATDTMATQTINVICETEPTKVNYTCGPDQFICHDETCILGIHTCDGQPDCLTGEDEIDCLCEEDNFICSDGECIPSSKYCNFFHDCRDGSDEANCTFNVCPEKYRMCDNGQCMKQSKFGDYKTDCIDGSDEKRAYRLKPKNDTFRCYSGTYLASSMVRNMRVDCEGRGEEDEELHLDDVKRGTWMIFPNEEYTKLRKSNYTPYCPVGNGSLTRCRLDHVLCFERHLACTYDVDENGYISFCPDGDHLRNCKSFECPNNFKCPDSYCIPFHRVCDGTPDCKDGQDEMNCKNLSCPGLFKCSKEGICLDQTLVCDGTVHCTKSFDDETMCSLQKCPQRCICKGKAVTCTDPTDETLPTLPFDIRSLHLITNTNTSLQLRFTDFIYLGWLRLANLTLHSLEVDLFVNLHNLLLLDLSDNHLTTITKGMFSGLGNLQHLYLYNNPIRALEESAFHGLDSIGYLHLNNLKIKELIPGCFSGLHKIKRLSLDNNFISDISVATWKGLESLKWLSVVGNPMKGVSADTFKNFTLDELHTDHHKFCCIAKGVKECTPKGDALSSCNNLIEDPALRVVIWIFGVAAVLGNVVVIFIRLITQAKQTLSILIINLSVSDCLMGVYLLILASVDLTYRSKGQYVLFADEWLSSGLCKTAAFMSTLSSEMSVFMLVVITADRFAALVFPIATKRLSLTKTLLILSLGWVLFSILSVMPLLGLPYFGEKYIQNGACLLFNITSGKTQGWEYSTFVFLLFNVTGCVFLFVAYIYIYCYLDKTRKAAKRAAGDKEIELAERFVLIVVTDFLCWMPIVVTSFMSLSGIFVNPTVTVWLAILILPVNSALNPFLYTFSAVRQTKQKRKKKRTGRTPQTGRIQ